MQWLDRVLLLCVVLFQAWFFWRSCQDTAGKELQRHLDRRVDSLEALIKQKNSRLDTLYFRLDSIRKEKPVFQKNVHYETMQMPDFIQLLNERYSDY